MWYVWRHERMLSRIVGFDKGAVWRSRSMLDIDQHLTCKVGMHVVSVMQCHHSACSGESRLPS